MALILFEGDFFIDRSNPRKAKACLDKVEQRLKNKGRVLIFPEGTRSETNQLLPFKRGAFKLSAASNAPIILVILMVVLILLKKVLNCTTGHCARYIHATH